MAFDPTVLSQIADYAPNPIKAKSDALSLSDMMDQNQLGKLKLTEAKESRAETQRAKEILGKSDLSTFEGQTRAAQELVKISPKLGMDFMAKVQSGRSAENEISLQKLQIADAQQDALVGALDPSVAQLSDLRGKGKEPAIVDAQAKNLVIPALLRLRQARPDLAGVVDKFQQDPQNLTYEGILSADQQSKRGSQAIKDRIAQMTADTNARREAAYERDVASRDTDRGRRRELGETGMLDDDTLKEMVEQYRAGDTTVVQNLGRGAQGAANIVKFRQNLARQLKAEGKSGAEQAAAIADFRGIAAGERAAGTRMAGVEIAGNEAYTMIDLARTASHAVDRSNFMPLAKAENLIQTNRGNPELAKFVAATTSLVNAYARAVSPSGTPTVADKEHAYAMLNTAQSTQAYDAVLDQLKAEIEAAKAAPRTVRKDLRDAIAPPSSTPPASGPAAAPPPGKFGAGGAGTFHKITGDADYNALPSGAMFIGPDGVTRKKP